MQTERFFADLHAAYARLAGDPAGWQEELDERAEMEGTLADGSTSCEHSLRLLLVL